MNIDYPKTPRKEKTQKMTAFHSEILKNISWILPQHVLAYWLDSGRILGSLHRQEFMPWNNGKANIVLL